MSLLRTITGDAGGAVGTDVAGNINLTGGPSVTVTGTPGTNSLEITVGGVLEWTREAGAAVAAVENHGYINTNVALTTITLPVAAAVVTTIAIVGESAAGWIIAQNAGQSIQFSGMVTTVGVGGTLASNRWYDIVYIVCRVANTTWSVVNVLGGLDVI